MMESSDNDASEGSDFEVMESELESDDDSESDDMDNSFSEEEYEAEMLSGGWNRVADIFSDTRASALPDLDSNYSGVNPAMGFSDSMSVIECFQKFVSRNVTEYVADCINDRAKVFFQQHPEKKGMIYNIKWKDVDSDALYVFLALYIYTGICKYSEITQYWARSPMESGVHFYTASIMSRDRYLSIMKFLRFSKVTEVKRNDSSSRLSTFCDMVNEISMRSVDPGADIAIDEALILFKGRLHFRRFIRAKRSRFGMRLFVMCRSDKNWCGYNSQLSIYNGKNKFTFPQDMDVAKLSVSEQVVVYLAKDVLGQGRHIIVDDWYASTRLASFLEAKKTLMTGTIRPNRGLPKEFIEENLERYASAFIRKENTLVVKWQDKKAVHVISTKYKAGLVEKDKTYFGGVRKVFKKPCSIEKYNTYMGGVHMADHLLEPYEPSRKSHAWFKKLGLHLIMRLMLNSFLVYKNLVKSKLTLRKYIQTVVKELLVSHSHNGSVVMEKYIVDHPRAGRKRKPEKVEHALVPIPPTECKKRPSKRCRVCYPKRKDTRSCCLGCPELPGLCSIEHFRAYHGK